MVCVETAKIKIRVIKVPVSRKIVQQKLLSGGIVPPPPLSVKPCYAGGVPKRPDLARPTTQQACCVTGLASYQPTTPFPAQRTEPMNILSLVQVEKREKVSRAERKCGGCLGLPKICLVFKPIPATSYERITCRSLDYRHFQSFCTLLAITLVYPCQLHTHIQHTVAQSPSLTCMVRTGNPIAAQETPIVAVARTLPSHQTAL